VRSFSCAPVAASPAEGSSSARGHRECCQSLDGRVFDRLGGSDTAKRAAALFVVAEPPAAAVLRHRGQVVGCDGFGCAGQNAGGAVTAGIAGRVGSKSGPSAGGAGATDARNVVVGTTPAGAATGNFALDALSRGAFAIVRLGVPRLAASRWGVPRA